MQRFLLFLSLSLLCLAATGQETKKVTKQTTIPDIKETFYVLKSNKKVKQGEYLKEFAGRTSVKGYFENNQKSGIWEFYGWDGKQLVQKFDYTNNILLYDQSLENPDFDSTRYARPAIYIGGRAGMVIETYFSISYPKEAIRKGVQGIVYIKALITEDGKMINEEVVDGVGYGLDEESLRVFKLVPDNWLPALDKEGNPVASEVTFDLNYRVK